LNLTNNHISRIENISDAFPNLENLVLLGNRLSSLQELDNLSYCRNLTRLYLLNNPITEDPNYRYYVIHRVPTLKVLDFQRIKKEEREKATKLYGELSLLSQKEKLAKMTKKDKIKVEDRVIKLAIEKAKTVEEINRLEILLKCGELSEAILDQKLIEYKIF
jgi:U2 small nuclear ribonucleoprotein A'